jgi:glycosyltransferase involved in cell wall biosynthesis
MALPVILWERYLSLLAPEARRRTLAALLNYGVMARLGPCDVFICMSGIYLEAAAYARRRFGARIWLERGSRHILSQDKILADVPGADRPSPNTIRRELRGYELADRIVVGSRQVADSFAQDPKAAAELFVNPYGVDLAAFPLREAKRPGNPFVFVSSGGWSLRKGSDLLADAVRKTTGVRLIHVGPLGDLPFPAENDRFTHVPKVPQQGLPEIYGQADAMVLASREEGLALVLGQALAMGLPTLCTDRTGGVDLGHTEALAQRITVVPHDDASALASAMGEMRDRLAKQDLPPLAESDRQTLSWAAYGNRYSQELLKAVR